MQQQLHNNQLIYFFSKKKKKKCWVISQNILDSLCIQIWDLALELTTVVFF